MFFDIHEQRRFFRMGVNFPARISFFAEGEEAPTHLSGRVLDISDAGFRMELENTEALSSGQHLDVILYPPDHAGVSSEPVEIEATLVWLEHNVPEDGRMLIGAYLNDLLDLGLDAMDEEDAHPS